MFGLVAESPPVVTQEVFYLWPENLAVWQLFMDCDTQWRSGMNGREGLDYSGVRVVMEMHGVRKQRPCFLALQKMERTALQAWDEMKTKTRD